MFRGFSLRSRSPSPRKKKKDTDATKKKKKEKEEEGDTKSHADEEASDDSDVEAHGEVETKDDTGAIQEDHTEFMLKVKVLRARDLSIADKKTKSSDPFVQVKLRNEKFQTSSQDKTLNPKWNEEFTFGDSTKSKKARPLKGDETVLFHVLDKDFVFNDDLGGASVSLSELKSMSDFTMEKWIPLVPFAQVQEELNKRKTKKNVKSSLRLGDLLVHCQLIPITSSSEPPSTAKEVSVERDVTSRDERDTDGAKRHSSLTLDMAKVNQASALEDDTADKSRSLKSPDPNVLLVHVLQARKLKAADRRGTSDPYCVIKFGKQEKKTKPLRKTLEPKWDAEFELQVQDKRGKVINSDLVIKVFDDDFLMDDAIGQVTISYEELKLLNHGGAQWYELTANGKKTKKTSLGEIELDILYNYHSVDGEQEEESPTKEPEQTPRKSGLFNFRSLSPRRNKSGTPNTSRSKQTESARKQSSTDEEPERTTGRSKKGGDLPSVVAPFKLVVCQAKGLLAADGGKTSDPFCVIRLGKEKVKTKTKSKTLSPEWEETFAFGKRGVNETWEWDTPLEIQIRDADFLSSDGLGIVKLSLQDLFSIGAGQRKWFDVSPDESLLKRLKKKKIPVDSIELGSIQLEATFESQDGANADRSRVLEQNEIVSPGSDVGEDRVVTLKVLQGRNLKVTDMLGTCDPYCVVSYKSEHGKTERFKTKVVKNTTNPNWGESASFLLQGLSFEDPEDCKVTLKIMDKDLLTSDFVGKAEVKVIEALRVTEPQWIPLEPKGELQIQLIPPSKAFLDSLPKVLTAVSAETVLQHLQQKLKEKKETVESLRKAFDIYDKDGSGTMDFTEFKQLLSFFRLADNLQESDLATLFNALDEDKNGVIVFRELEMLLEEGNQTSSRSAYKSRGKLELAVLGDVMERVIRHGVEARRRPGNNQMSELVEDFVADLRRNFELFDEDKARRITIGDRLNRVLVLSKSVPVTDEKEQQALSKAFGSPMRYLEFCELVLDYDVSKLIQVQQVNVQQTSRGLPESEQLQKQCKLVVSVLRAESLRPADRGGTSDPYCIVQVGKESQKTKVVKKNLNPTWNQELVFGKKGGLKAGMDVKITVKDKDLLFSDLLGQAMIPISDIAQNQPEEKELSLTGGTGKAKASGTIWVRVHLQVEESEGGLKASPPLKSVDEYVDGMEFHEVASPQSVGSVTSAKSSFSIDSGVQSFSDMNESKRWHDQQLREIRDAVAKASRANRGNTQLREELEKLDVRQKGYISAKRLQSGLESFGVHLSPSQLAAILPRVDPEGVDRINYSLFCKIVRSEAALASHKSKSVAAQVVRTRLERILSRAVAKKMGLGALFAAFDPNASGLVTDQDFSAVLRALDGQIDSKDIILLAQTIPGAEQGGFVHYETLCKAVCPNVELRLPSAVKSPGKGKQGLGQYAPAEEVLQKFKYVVRRLSKHGTNPDAANVGRAFERFDRNGDGKISKVEFRNFIENTVNLDPALTRDEAFTEEEIQVLLQRFDLNGNGEIDYLEFLQMISMSKQELERSLERFRKRLVAKIRQRQNMQEPSLLAEFSRLDKDGSGRVSRREFRLVLEAVGEASYLNQDELRYLMDKFDCFNTGSIKYHEFVEFVHGQPISLSAATSDAGKELGLHDMDRVMRGTVEAKPVWTVQHQNDSMIKHQQALSKTTGTLGAVDGQGVKPVDLWHPSTIGEWLEKYASAAERRDFDEIYNAVSEFSTSSKPDSPTHHRHATRRPSSPFGKTAPSSQNHYRHITSSSPLSQRALTSRFVSPDHFGVRSPSPMDRSCKTVGWECRACRHVNRSLRHLNDCSKCGAVRSASAKVIVDQDSDESDRSSCSSSSSYGRNGRRRRSSKSRKHSHRRRGRSTRRKSSHDDESDSSKSSSSSRGARRRHHSKTRHHRRRKSTSRSRAPIGLLPPSPKIVVVDELSLSSSSSEESDSSYSSSSSSSASSMSSSGLRTMRSSSVFSDDFWGNVNAQRSALEHEKWSKDRKRQKKEERKMRKKERKKREKKKEKKKKKEEKRRREKERKRSKSKRHHRSKSRKSRT